MEKRDKMKDLNKEVTMNFEEIQEKCFDFIKPNFKISKSEKAITDVAFHISACLVKHKIDFEQYIIDYNNDVILDVSFLNKPGYHCFLDYVDSKYLKFVKEMYLQRPIGLGTPNAACGEGEFMLQFCSPHTNIPSSGDIEYDGSIKECKNKEPRVMSKISGTVFRDKTVELAKKYNLTPEVNKNYPNGSVQLYSKETTYWNNELSILSLEDRKMFLKKWLELLGCFDDKRSAESVEKILIGGILNRKSLINEMCKNFYTTTKKDEADNLIMFLDNHTLVNIEYSYDNICKMFDNGTLNPKSDYRRLNQTMGTGWYYTINTNTPRSLIDKFI